MASLRPPGYIPQLALSFKNNGAKSRESVPNEVRLNAEAELNDLRPGILSRDKYACVFCGLPAPKTGGGLHIHHLNANFQDTVDTNLVTACPLCHAILHFWRSCADQKIKNAMQMLWLPWIRQEDLNILVFGMAVVDYRKRNAAGKSPVGAGKLADAAMALDMQIRKTGEFPDDLFPENLNDAPGVRELMHDPSEFVKAMMQVSRLVPDFYEKRTEILKNFRIFFDYTKVEVLFGKTTGIFESQAWLPGPRWLENWKRIAAAQRGEECPS
jgi:hypothetical protein